MLECNVFQIDASIEGRFIQWAVYTDLPCGTAMSVSFDRFYRDYHDTECLWTLHDQELIVAPTNRGDLNGGEGKVDVDKGDRDALKEFNSLDSYSKGIKERVEDKIVVKCVVGARQRLKAFGKNNVNLTGGLVQDAGGINVVEESVALNCPLKNEFQPLE